MTATPPVTRPEADPTAARPSTRRLVRTGAIAGVIGAIATTSLAAAASVADIALEVDGQAIPLPAFAWWTVVGTALGVVLARVLGDPRRFVTVTVAVTAASLVPAIAAPDDTATGVVLVLAHLLAAAIVIPVLGRALAPTHDPG